MRLSECESVAKCCNNNLEELSNPLIKCVADMLSDPGRWNQEGNIGDNENVNQIQKLNSTSYN